MHTYGAVFRHVPWTCQWGEFGSAWDPATHDEPRAVNGGRGWTPWTCQHPEALPAEGYLRHGDCDNCPFWTLAGCSSRVLIQDDHQH